MSLPLVSPLPSSNIVPRKTFSVADCVITQDYYVMCLTEMWLRGNIDAICISDAICIGEMVPVIRIASRANK